MNCWLNTVTFIGMSTVAVFMRVTSAELEDWYPMSLDVVTSKAESCTASPGVAGRGAGELGAVWAEETSGQVTQSAARRKRG